MVSKSDKEVNKPASSHELNRRLCELVVDAIEKLEDQNGSSHKAIKNYITTEHELNVGELSRHLSTALRRGINFGLLTKSGGKYKLTESFDKIKAHRHRRRSRGRRRRSHSRRRRRRSRRHRSRSRRRRRRR